MKNENCWNLYNMEILGVGRQFHVLIDSHRNDYFGQDK
jgi:hypothetical protein